MKAELWAARWLVSAMMDEKKWKKVSFRVQHQHDSANAKFWLWRTELPLSRRRTSGLTSFLRASSSKRLNVSLNIALRWPTNVNEAAARDAAIGKSIWMIYI